MTGLIAWPGTGVMQPHYNLTWLLVPTQTEFANSRERISHHLCCSATKFHTRGYRQPITSIGADPWKPVGPRISCRIAPPRQYEDDAKQRQESQQFTVAANHLLALNEVLSCPGWPRNQCHGGLVAPLNPPPPRKPPAARKCRPDSDRHTRCRRASPAASISTPPRTAEETPPGAWNKRGSTHRR